MCQCYDSVALACYVHFLHVTAIIFHCESWGGILTHSGHNQPHKVVYVRPLSSRNSAAELFQFALDISVEQASGES